MAPKRTASPIASTTKKVKVEGTHDVQPEEVNTPLVKLYAAITAANKVKALPNDAKGVVVYWMRNKDLRLEDNTALAEASAQAIALKQPLIILHIFSPSDYTAHDRSPRRIDFQLRQLANMQQRLVTLNVPLHSPIYLVRKDIPRRVGELMKSWGATYLYGNIEYEVDELARDAAIVRNSMEARQSGNRDAWGGQVIFLRDHCVIAPGLVLTKVSYPLFPLCLPIAAEADRSMILQQDKPYSVYSPWYKNWSAQLQANPMMFLADAGTLVANDLSMVTHPIVAQLLPERVPDGIEGWTLNAEDQAKMNHIWPVGDTIVDQVSIVPGW